jgi:hypothetical protein
MTSLTEKTQNENKTDCVCLRCNVCVSEESVRNTGTNMFPLSVATDLQRSNQHASSYAVLETALPGRVGAPGALPLLR